ncbi:MAG: Hsp20/alpha crystallin family protein [Pirellulaceae bacterium]
MLTRWDSMQDTRNEMSRLYDVMMRMFDRADSGGRLLTRPAFPPLNLWEDADHLFVEAELPGLELADLEIYVTGDNQLSIKGERRTPEKTSGTWHRQERGFGAFARVVELPAAVDSERVTAEFSQGVLTITLPKREEVKPRRIDVKCSN